MDIWTVALLAAGLFGAAAGKIAARKLRFWPGWMVYGAITGPIALAHVMLVPSLVACPSCGRRFSMKPGRPCPRCGWTLPLPLQKSYVAASVREVVGFGLGDRASKIERRLRRRGVDFKRTSPDELTFVHVDGIGRPSDVAVEFDAGRAAMIKITYPVDEEYAIYYELKAELVARYGRPDYENFDDGYSDNWSAKSLLVSLSTTNSEHSPSTSVVFQKLGAALEKNMAELV